MKCCLYYEVIQWPCSREKIRQRWGLWEVRRFGAQIRRLWFLCHLVQKALRLLCT